MKVERVMFFPNGNTAAFNEGEQIPELQRPWILMYVEFLQRQGVDPTDVEFMLPGGPIIRVFKLPDGGWNWRIG